MATDERRNPPSPADLVRRATGALKATEDAAREAAEQVEAELREQAQRNETEEVSR